MFRKMFALALVLMFVGAGTGYTQIVEKSSDLTGFAGILSIEDGDTEFTFGARYAYHMNSYSTIEGSFGFAFPENAKIYNYFVNYRYNILMDNPKVVPFATGGVGAVTISYDSDLLDGTTDMSINFGGGLLFFMQEQIGIRADVRDLVVFGDNNTTNNIEVTGGVSYFFM